MRKNPKDDSMFLGRYKKDQEISHVEILVSPSEVIVPKHDVYIVQNSIIQYMLHILSMLQPMEFQGNSQPKRTNMHVK